MNGQILITGPEVFKYVIWRQEDVNTAKLTIQHSQLNNRDDSSAIQGMNITCHAWN